MFWVVQSNLHREEGHARLLAALGRAGSRFAEVQVLPFTDKLVPADVDIRGQDLESLPDITLPASTSFLEVAFAMGSYKLVRILRKKHVLGGYLGGLRYTEWAEGWGHEHLLNPHAQVVPFCAAHLARVGREVFVRPVADSKEFAGRVFSRGAFYRWIKEAEQEGSQHVPPDTEVLVAPVVRDIHSETRFWVVDGNVVTWSLYKRGGKAFQSEDVDPSVVSFARALAMRWCPSPAFVVDVAVTGDGPKVVEANCLSAAGFYAGDMQKLVFALEDYFNGRKPGSGPIDKVYMEVGTGVGNLAGIQKLELSRTCTICGKEVCDHLSLSEELRRMEEQPMPAGMHLIESARMFEAMGVPKEFLDGPADFASSEAALRAYSQRARFDAQFLQQPDTAVYCRCGHVEDDHRVNSPREWREHGVGYCRAQGPRICDCDGFVLAGEDAEHMHRCRVCSDLFDRRELDQVIAHQHAGPREAIRILGRKL